ncbi:MAG: CPBP family intramembrane metalloprotease [Opitutaceae bacterium]|nr:CPBP family intramembrane metalloprotease [Opitutaceae bacterium]
MSENPLAVAAMIAVAAVILHIWWGDLRAHYSGKPNARAFPGAVPCSRQSVLLAVAGALFLLALETGGEVVLGLDGQQGTVTILWSGYTLMAAFVEELTFRGYLVVAGRGRTWLWASIVAFSLLFALCHPFLWSWEEGRLLTHFTTKGWFSTATVFLCSLWFYTVRFFPMNPERSLIPCIAAHLTKNLGVFALKASFGFVSGWY